MFPSVSPKQSFPDLESEILAFWKANSIFQKSIDSRPEDNPYRFYDGPPFITGTPHYGSLLSSVVKDVVGRYWTMRGKRVERVWGWDCHGLPIEEKVQKKLGLSSNKEIEERGVKEFIDGCYEYTESTSAEWKWYIDKIGRWVDMDRAYRTMDQDYMESVMWVFHQLWNKGLIYEGKRVSLYSWKLGTPISNFEVAMDDTYQEVHDPAITVKFKPLSQNSTGLIIKNQSGKVLFLKKKKNSKWTLVGGKCEEGESHIDCIKRETLEEIGLKIEDMRVYSWMGSVVHGKYWNECMFETDVTLEAVPVLEDTFSEYAFFSAEDFPELEAVEPYDRFMLEYLKGNMTQYPEPWNVNILAWTTTPWTIPANMALAVGKDIDYVLVEYSSLGKGILQKDLSPGTPLSGGDGERSETEGVDSIHHDNPPNPPLRGLTEGNPLGGLTEEMPFSGAEENPQSGILGTTHSGKESYEQFIVAKNRVEAVFKGKGEYTILREFKGSELIDLSYVPPFPEYYWEKFSVGNPLSGGDTEMSGTVVHRMERTPFSGGLQKDLSPGTPLSGGDGERSETEGVRETHDNPPNPPLRGLAEENPLRGLTEEVLFSEGNPQSSHTRASLQKNFHIYNADFATDSDGTGIVHIAPEFGESDFALAKKEGIAISEALDDAGKYTGQIFDHEGLHYQEANTVNIERMKENGTLFKHESITHRVPFCPRSNTPLVQKAQKSWFIDIESQKEKLLKANEQIHWFPEYLKFGRFAKGIESAPDWCISRTRYWGAPMPVWVGKDGEKLVVGSREEIFERNKPYGQLTKLIITRHAQSEANVQERYDDTGLSPLSEKGRKQAEELITEWGDESIDIIITSPFTRAISTAEPLAQRFSLEIIHDERLKETDHGKLANAFTHTEAVKEARRGLFGDDHHYRFGETGESYDDIEKRMKSFVEDICERYPGKTVFVVSHGFPVRIMSEYLTGKIAPDKTKNASARAFILDVVNKNLLNLHKPYIDSVKLQKDGTEYTRVPEVLDVWMDSGSMPYAQMHYPFENREEMESSFPADFIAEYVGQVRAWFYVMHVLGVLLNPNKEAKPTPSFTNVITTGVINGNDGRKMSKSYGNYPDPRDTILKYGADPIRFYMLNSPLLSGGDMDFKEEGIVETIKSVMLPLWNTYSFFTTYANIDHWGPDGTEIWFSRHAQSESNVISKMSDDSDNPALSEEGRNQARSAGISLREQGKTFDVIIHTSLTRTHDTAHILGEAMGFSGEYIIDDGFAEQKAGEYAGKTLTEIAHMKGLDPKDYESLRRVYKNNAAENIEQLEERILGAYAQVLEKYRGKKVLIVGHAAGPRPLLHRYFGIDADEAHYRITIPNATPFKLLNTPLVNPLDRWILSRLQILLGVVHDAMESYDVSRACRAIVEFMDALTNWYVRLSRRRFWGSDMTDDKYSAYSTLYTVLLESSKILAPFMPFLAESIYKGLTDISPLGKEGASSKGNGDEMEDLARRDKFSVPSSHHSSFTQELGENSVHLQYATLPHRFLIAEDLNRDMEKCEQIVSLGLSLRSRKGIRVRQPLESITITEILDPYYKEIIRDELNVKEVRFENPEKIARKICKPDARKIGPKYGKDMQYIINEAKAGNFREADGKIYITRNAGREQGSGDAPRETLLDESHSFILESGEYTLEYLPLEGIGDVEGGYGRVIAIDMEITEDLLLEGYARDIIRMIQDMRKEADYKVTDRISLHIYGEGHAKILAKFGLMIASETLSRFTPLMHAPDIQKEMLLDDTQRLTIQIEK